MIEIDSNYKIDNYKIDKVIEKKTVDKSNEKLNIGPYSFSNRLFIGTGKYSSTLIPEIINKTNIEVVTVAIRRINFLHKKQDNILNYIPEKTKLLINTSGSTTCDEAIKICRIAKEAGYGTFVKIEIIGETKYLMPDNMETLKATEILAKEGFTVLPYFLPDPVFAYRLYNAGASALMPMGSPIGSGRGLKLKETINILLEQKRLPIIIDAGIGKPSDACKAMEMGCDAVLINSAIAMADNPINMAIAFNNSVIAGRLGFLSGLMPESKYANPSSPQENFIFT